MIFKANKCNGKMIFPYEPDKIIKLKEGIDIGDDRSISKILSLTEQLKEKVKAKYSFIPSNDDIFIGEEDGLDDLIDNLSELKVYFLKKLPNEKYDEQMKKYQDICTKNKAKIQELAKIFNVDPSINNSYQECCIFLW